MRSFVLLAMALLANPTLVLAQTKLTKPVRVIVPYVQGGGSDTLARMLAPYLAEDFGQQVLVENRAGAGSTIGTQVVARAAPDGYTIGMIDAAFVTNPSLLAKMPYDTLKDFEPVVFIARTPLVLLAHPSLGVTDVKAFVDLAKSKPGQLAFGSAGNGTGVHLAAEQLKLAAGIDLIHVPYKGAGQALTELLGGQTAIMFTIPANARSHAASGRARALAITSAKRSPAMPELTTFAEAGFPNVDSHTINGFVLPLGTSPEFVQRLNDVVNRALKTPELEKKLYELGFEAVGGSSASFANWIRAEIPKWARIIKDAGVKAEQ
jgi:tripartite-type tricarboxylate transporter receptor subunit TctC